MNKKDIFALVDDYAKHLKAVDYWSDKQKSSLIFDRAYESRDKLEQIIVGLNIFPINKRKI